MLQGFMNSNVQSCAVLLDAEEEVNHSENLFLDVWTKIEECATKIDRRGGNLFQFMDDDGSGDITPEEFQLALKKLGVKLTNDEMEIVVKEIDEDGDGSISVSEFENAVQRHRDFKGFNSDGDIDSSDEEDEEEAKAAAEKAEQEEKGQEAEEGGIGKPILEEVLKRWTRHQLTNEAAVEAAPENVSGIMQMFSPETEAEGEERDREEEEDPEKKGKRKKKKRRKRKKPASAASDLSDTNQGISRRGSAVGERASSICGHTSWQRTVAVTASLTPCAFQVGLREKTRDPLEPMSFDGDEPKGWGSFTVVEDANRISEVWNKDETFFANKLVVESDPIQALQLVATHWQDRLALSPDAIDVDGVMAGEAIASSAMLVQLFARSPNMEIDKTEFKELLERLARLRDQVEKLKTLADQDFDKMGKNQKRRSIDIVDQHDNGSGKGELVLRNKRMPRLTMLVARVQLDDDEVEKDEEAAEEDEEKEDEEDEEKNDEEDEEKGEGGQEDKDKEDEVEGGGREGKEEDGNDDDAKIRLARVASRRAAGKASKGRNRAAGKASKGRNRTTFAIGAATKPKASKASNPFLNAATAAADAAAAKKETNLKMRWIKSHTHQVAVHLAKVSFEMKKLQDEIVTAIIRAMQDQARFAEIQGRVCSEAVGNAVEQWVECRTFDPSAAMRKDRAAAEAVAVTNSLVRGRLSDVLPDDSSDEMLFLRGVIAEFSDPLRRM
jgi:hypothetical protein